MKNVGAVEVYASRGKKKEVFVVFPIDIKLSLNLKADLDYW